MIKSKLVLYLVFFILFFIITNVIAKEQYLIKVEEIRDGDTFVVNWETIPFNMNKIGIRIKGIDTAEIHTKCAKEKSFGMEAKAFLSYWINQKNVIISNCEPDKFGGRWLCDVEYNGQDIAAAMITNGFARPYNGEKKIPWCKDETIK